MTIVVAPQESPRVVQLMSAPYNGDVVLVACPARFGLDLSKGDVGVRYNIQHLGRFTNPLQCPFFETNYSSSHK